MPAIACFLRVRTLAALVLMALMTGTPGSPVAAQSTDEDIDTLIGLIMIEQSAEFCSFPLTDDVFATLIGQIDAHRTALGLNDTAIEDLYIRTGQQFQERMTTMCDPNGSWKKLYDETVGQLRDAAKP